MGYLFAKKKLKFIDLEKKEFFVSRDVKFYEDVFPFFNVEEKKLPCYGQ